MIWLYDRGGAISHTVKVDAPNESSPENGVFGNYGEVAENPTSREVRLTALPMS